MNRNTEESDVKNLEGNALTREQLSDVYASGTSDGIHTLAKGSFKLSGEPVDAHQAEEETKNACD